MRWKQVATSIFLVITALALTQSIISAQDVVDRFLRFLPFPTHSDMRVQQGWHGCPSCGIDYILGKLDDSDTWQKYDVIAAADGEACGNCTLRLGNAVWIRHNVDGRTYYTYYGHLSEIAVGIPRHDLGQTGTKTVRKGDKIGVSGDTGTKLRWIHVHFMLKDRTNTARDPYGIRTSREYYYPRGEKYGQAPLLHTPYWTTDPPSYSLPGSITLAVTPPYWDDIGTVLSRPELGYPWTQIQITDLASYSLLSQYDAVFINCTFDIQSTPQVAAALQQYVQNGGSIYASDWAYEYIQDAFPGYINFQDNPKIGIAQRVTANITDHGLATYINSTNPPSTIDLDYDLDEWVVIDSVGPSTTVHVRGSFNTFSSSSRVQLAERHWLDTQQESLGALGQLTNKPLVVSFQPYGSSPGRVIYTTFHNEAQQTELEKKLLEYLGLVPLSGAQQQAVAQAIAVEELDLIRTDINTIDPGATSPQFIYVYSRNDIDPRLAFALAWPGSSLKLSVYRPNGSLYQQIESNEPPIKVVIPNAENGNWKYQVTGVNVPYSNYPYVIGIGVKSIEKVYLPTILKNFDGISPPPVNTPPPANTPTFTPTPTRTPTPTPTPTPTSTPVNNPPNTPANPSPADGATDQSLSSDLSWTGGDPNGDTVTYDIYFEANDSTPDVLISNDQSSTTYNPGTLNAGTHYYWKITATDEHGATTTGPVWDFTTLLAQQPPVAPSNLQAIPLDSTSIQLNWVDESNNESGFDIYDGDIFIATVGTNTTSYTVEGLGINSYHCYHIYAFNDYGNSPWTDWACATTTSLPLTGRVTHNGISVAGTEIVLRYYDGSDWLTYDTTTTDFDGTYQFSYPPSLGGDQSLYVQWLNNDSNSSRLTAWTCWGITASTTDPNAYQCNFDLDNVDLLLPESGATVSLPYTFTWDQRVSTTDDYELNLADMSDMAPWWWTYPSLGYVDSYTLIGLPEGFSPGEQYGWFMWVYGQNGYGVSYYYHNVIFSNSGTTVVATVPVSARISKENIEVFAPPHSR